jgi:hypothetical protein
MHGSDVVALLSSLSGVPSVIDIILGIRSIIGIHLEGTLKTSPRMSVLKFPRVCDAEAGDSTHDGYTPSPRRTRPTALHNDVPS